VLLAKKSIPKGVFNASKKTRGLSKNHAFRSFLLSSLQITLKSVKSNLLVMTGRLRLTRSCRFVDTKTVVDDFWPGAFANALFGVRDESVGAGKSARVIVWAAVRGGGGLTMRWIVAFLPLAMGVDLKKQLA
jgi:hypothetical protein